MQVFPLKFRSHYILLLHQFYEQPHHEMKVGFIHLIESSDHNEVVFVNYSVALHNLISNSIELCKLFHYVS